MSDLGRAITRLYDARARVYRLMADLQRQQLTMGITSSEVLEELEAIYRTISEAVTELERC